MKKTNIFYFIVLLAFSSIFMTACHNDDSNDKDLITCPTDNQSAAKLIAGNYDGEMGTTLSSANFNNMTFPDTINQKIVITHDTLNYISIVYKDWSNGGVNYGDLKVSPVEVSVSEENNTILVEGNCKQILHKGGRGFEADIAVAGTFTPEEKHCNLLFKVNMPVSPMMTLDFKLTYNGKPE